MFTDNTVKLINDIRNESSTNNKLAIIEQNAEELKGILYYCYNPFLMYGFSSKILQQAIDEYEKNPLPSSGDFLSFEGRLKALSTTNITNNIRMNTARYILDSRKELRDIIFGILTKDLKLGVNIKSINKAIPNLIPVFDVQASYPLEKYPLKYNEWISISLKMNGIRGVYTNQKLVTRKGLPIAGSEKLAKELHKMLCDKFGQAGWDFCIDGELVLIDELRTGDDNVDFRTATKYVKLGEFDKLKYVMFDIFKADDSYKLTYQYRIHDIHEMAIGQSRNPHISMVEVYYSGYDHSYIGKLMSDVVKPNNYEGLMINKDVPYKKSRHNGVLKVKEFYTIDLEIVDVLEGTERLTGTMGSLLVKFKDNTVKVGSGYTDDLRNWLWERKEDLIGRVIEVQYKEVSTNESTGLQSLQFPTFIRLREEGKEVNYEQL